MKSGVVVLLSLVDDILSSVSRLPMVSAKPLTTGLDQSID